MHETVWYLRTLNLSGRFLYFFNISSCRERNGVWNLCAPDEAGNGGRYYFVNTSKGDLEYVSSELE